MAYNTKEKMQAHAKRYRARRPEVHRRYVATRKKATREFIRNFKDRPCSDCVTKYPYYVMHLDHREPSEKLANPADLPRLGWGMARVIAELEKCDVVCANCHAERTYGKQKAGSSSG